MSKSKNSDINLLQISIIFSLVVIALSIAYYLIIFIPEKERAKLELSRQEFELKQAEQEAKDNESQVFLDCEAEATEGARGLIKSKIEIARKSGASVPKAWEEASGKGLYFKEDYNTYYANCLRRNGIKY